MKNKNKSEVFSNLKKQKDEEDNKLNELGKKLKRINSTIYNTSQANETTDSSNFKIKNQFHIDADEVKSIKTNNSVSEVFQRQNIEIRDSYHDAIQQSIKFQSSLRKQLSFFFIGYISIVTLIIFFIIIDPVALYRKVNSYYSDGIKLMLLGAFFANIVSVLVIIVKYSFEPSDKFIEAINKIGNLESKKK